MKTFFIFFSIYIVSAFASTPWLNENSTDLGISEGDIAFEDAPDSNEQTTEMPEAQDQQGHASPPELIRKWENKIVPFNIPPTFDKKESAIILAAMTEVENHTCISFVPRQQQKDYILFKKLDHGLICSSIVGRRESGGRQHVNLTDECIVGNTVLHELMHVLGFQHEHSRHDRDKYIQINLNHVRPKHKERLKIVRKVDPLDLHFPYDYKSITHYPVDAYSTYTNGITIRSKIPWFKIKADGLSEIDIWKINYVYNCSNEGERVASSNEHERTTITETSIGTTSKMTTSTTTRPISILNKEIINVVEVGNENRVRKLLNEGADVNARIIGEYENNTLLHIATKKGHVNVVSLLLDKGANIEAITTSNSTPLHYASQGGHANVASLLLDKGANIEAKDKSNSTPFHDAAQNGHVNVVSLLLDKGANIEARTIYKSTPLHYAAWYGHVNVVSLLVDKGANIEARTTSNMTPLHEAARYGRENVVSLLLDKGASIEAKDPSNSTPLHYAAYNGHVNVVSLLLDKGANIEAKAPSNSTPLHYAARGGHVNVVSLLVDKGANIEAKDTTNQTPLHYAAERGNVNVVSLLLDKDANIEARATYNWSPLHYASFFGSKSVVLLLLDNGAYIFAKGSQYKQDETPLDLAKRSNKTEIVEILERKQIQLTTE